MGGPGDFHAAPLGPDPSGFRPRELFPGGRVVPAMSRMLPSIDAQIEQVAQLLTDAQQLLDQHEVLLASASDLGDIALSRRARGLILTMREIRNERGRHLERLRSQAAGLRAEAARAREIRHA